MRDELAGWGGYLFGLVQDLEENLVYIYIYFKLVELVWSGSLGFKILKLKLNSIKFF
jgi:hypothetical protein